eukprot:gene17856-24942_t
MDKKVIKILLLGDGGVGKTSLIHKFVYDKFVSFYNFGEHIEIKNIIIGDDRIQLQIHDSQGGERYRSIYRQKVNGADAIILLYNITDRDSFNSISGWIGMIHNENKNDYILLPIVLVVGQGSSTARVISTEEGEVLAQQNGVAFLEACSFVGTNVDMLFTATAAAVLL